MKRLKKGRTFTSSKKVLWVRAPDIEKRAKLLITSLELFWMKKTRIFFMRSKNSKTRAAARIWGLSRIWQMTLGEPPAYILEVISERFDRLSKNQQDEVLIHELAHIPRTFSGALLPHTRRRKGSFHDKLKKLLAAYNRAQEV